MSKRRFLVFLGTIFVCSLLFAAPNLYKLYKEIRDAKEPIVPPSVFLTKKERWENGIEVEWTVVVSREEPPEQSKTTSKDAKKVFIAGEVSNTSDKTIAIETLDFVLKCGKATITDKPVITQSIVKTQSLKPQESKIFHTFDYWTVDTMGGLITNDVVINANASFSYAP